MRHIVRANMESTEGDVLSDEEIIGQVSCVTVVRFNLLSCTQNARYRTLVFAATDTTSSAVSRILHLLAQHKAVQERLRKEIVEARRDRGDLSFDDLFELPYLEAVCRETLRLYVRLLGRVLRYLTISYTAMPRYLWYRKCW